MPLGRADHSSRGVLLSVMYLSVCRASATGRSLMKRSPTECDVCECVLCLWDGPITHEEESY